ncbi:hypothetical protein BaRGS_00019719 [Batillaria attramentaria]|uniref:DNA excision repair protein ERCC-8 n=1 Tax=Batillaria attramentaria TaxID=370345 RepID=A0ABD0KQ44_9CAEN
MIRLLGERESGIIYPLIFQRAEVTRRNYCLELSKHKDVEGVHKGSINSVDLDVIENRYLLSGAADSSIVIHDTQPANGEAQQTYKHVCQVSHNSGSTKHSVETIQWYPIDTGMFTSSGADYQLKIWDTNRLKVADKYSFHGIVYSHHMSGISVKHCLIAVGCSRSTVKLVDMKAGSATHQLRGHDSSVFVVQWSSRDEFLLATCGADNRVLLWDIRSAKGSLVTLDQHNGESASHSKCAKTAHDGAVNGLRFTSDGLHLVTFGTDNQLRLWNAFTGKNMLVNYGYVYNTSRKAAQIALSCSGSPDVVFAPSDSNIEVVDLYGGNRITTLRGHYNSVNCCIHDCQTQYLYSGGSDRNILVWAPSSETEDYEEHLRDQSKESRGEKSFTQRTAATADTWSSDEEDNR